ncbi:MAG: nucleotidyltransferase domain-containing protein [Caldisphaera sp.]|jgi:predicted nucleotidyltransferase|nr:MAG: DNA polymerase subunit beta [Caldisphaera sp.]
MSEEQEIVYDNKRWELFTLKRKRAENIVKAILDLNLNIYIIGSLARGDIKESSDIDIVILESFSPYRIEISLENKGFHIFKKEIIQATPNYTPKAYIFLDAFDKEVISFPLFKLKPREAEFYKWGGQISYSEIISNKRVPGVNKELRLIIPTERGHIEMPILGRENVVAKKLNIDISTILERERVLSRRKEIGRTGVFLKYEVPLNESIEDGIRNLLRKNHFFRKFVENP